jgi:hypothetical protein
MLLIQEKGDMEKGNIYLDRAAEEGYEGRAWNL